MMKLFVKSLSLTTLAFSFALSSHAGDNLKRIGQIVVTSIDTSEVQTEYLVPDDVGRAVFDDQLDELVDSWYVNNVFIPGSQYPANHHHTPVELTDSVIVKRLQHLEEAVKLSYNSVVRDYIEMYLFRKVEQVEVMLGLTAYYFPLFEEIFDRYDLPLEMKYMAIIESALNPRAVSRAGAVGLWQFMFSTAKLLGLEVTTYVDDRRDVLKSTDAAARYISELYDIYHDWHLVIAAYNCGPGNVNKAIARSGGKTDYWQIYYLLPRETRGHVPAYIAASYALNYYKEYGLEPRMPSIALQSDTVMIGHTISLKQIADNLGLELDALRDLNPVYRRDVVPGKPDKKYPVRIPSDQVVNFIAKMDTIFNHERSDHFPGSSIVTPQTSAMRDDPTFDISGKTKIYYTVKQGDNPGYIANWFNVPLSELKVWNSISRNLIRVGQKLAIYVPDEKSEYYKKINNLSFAAKQELVGKPAETNPVTASEPEAVKGDIMADASGKEYECYTVRRGDNFWSIAKKYPGISNYEIMRLNNITDSRSLKTGQVLKIRPKT